MQCPSESALYVWTASASQAAGQHCGDHCGVWLQCAHLKCGVADVTCAKPLHPRRPASKPAARLIDDCKRETCQSTEVCVRRFREHVTHIQVKLISSLCTASAEVYTAPRTSDALWMRCRRVVREIAALPAPITTTLTVVADCSPSARPPSLSGRPPIRMRYLWPA